MIRIRVAAATTAAAFLTLGTSGVATAAVAEAALLPHPGPDGLVWVEEAWGDGGVASGGAYSGLPTVLSIACDGGGTVGVTMDSQQTQVAAFTVDCPESETGRGSVSLPAGVVRPGSFTIGVDASSEAVRWSLTVTQPE